MFCRNTKSRVWFIDCHIFRSAFPERSTTRMSVTVRLSPRLYIINQELERKTISIPSMLTVSICSGGIAGYDLYTYHPLSVCLGATGRNLGLTRIQWIILLLDLTNCLYSCEGRRGLRVYRTVSALENSPH